MSDLSIAECLFEADKIKSDLEDAVLACGIDFTDIGWDYYDNSLEIHGVPASSRLSPEGQKVIADAGFSKVYVNHIDKWETHYILDPKILPTKGWRVSYPHKRGTEESGVWVESAPEKWPKEWFETGKAVIKEAT